MKPIKFENKINAINDQLLKADQDRVRLQDEAIAETDGTGGKQNQKHGFHLQVKNGPLIKQTRII